MKWKLGLIFVLVGSLFLIGCEKVQEETVIEEGPEQEAEEEQIEPVEDVMEPQEAAAPQACTTYADCGDGNQCIDLVCGKLSEMYDTLDCDAICRFTDVVIQTNDGKTHDLVAGKGSYTAAGALQWKVESGPKHCQGQEVRVPLEITKYNYGEKVNEEFITLAKGETSRVLNHPTITSVAFTLKVEDIKVECS